MEDTATWIGQSGDDYLYVVYCLPEHPETTEEGNYIFANQGDIGEWFAVYVGQGRLKDRYDAALAEGCVTYKEATHFHAHLNDDEYARKQEEKDIIAGNPECKHPYGCNGHG